MKRLNIAMLSQQAQAEVEPIETQSELDVVGQQVEDSIAEATQVQAEIEGTQQAMDDAEQVIQEVEEERQVLEQAQQQGGAEQPAMEALQRAVARFEKRTGVACSIRSMGMESFSSKSTRARSTAVAMEGAVEFIKKLIKMLTDAMAAVWEKVAAFFEKIWVGAERAAKRAAQLEAAAKAAQGKTASADAKVTAGSVLSFARMGGKVVEGKEFADEYIKLTAANNEARKFETLLIKESLKDGSFEKALEAAKTKDNAAAILPILTKTASENGETKDGFKIISNDSSMLGDFGVAGKLIDKGITWEQLSTGYNSIFFKVQKAENAKEVSAKDVKPLSVEDAKRVAAQAQGHMSSYADMRKEVTDIDKGVKAIIAAAKKLEKEKDAPVDQIRVVSGYARAQVNASVSLLTSARAYDVNLTKAALDYVAASIKAATGKAAESAGTQVATTDDTGKASASTKKTQML